MFLQTSEPILTGSIVPSEYSRQQLPARGAADTSVMTMMTVPLPRSDMVRRWALKVCREPEKEDKTVLLSRLNLGGLIDIRKALEYMDVRPSGLSGGVAEGGGEEHVTNAD